MPRPRCRHCGAIMTPIYQRGLLPYQVKRYCGACLYVTVEFCYQPSKLRILESWLSRLQARRLRTNRRGG